MEFSGQIRKWRFKSSNNQKHLTQPEASEYSGDFTFCWPYRWISDLDKFQPLVDQQAADVSKYISRRFKWPDKVDPAPLINDCIWMATFTTKWAEDERINSRAYRKMLIYNVYFVTAFILGDLCERIEGHSRHSDFVQSLGRLLQKIFLLKFKSIEDIEQDQLFLTLKEITHLQVGPFAVYFDVIEDMKSEFDVTPEIMTCFARTFRESYELQTWFGSKGNSHFLDLELRNELRSRAVGMEPTLEFVLVLDGIHPTQNIRANYYFQRLYQYARTLGYLLNDSLSVLKELEEARKTGKRFDNSILLTMEVQNLTFGQALELILKRHNKKVLEFRGEVEYLLADERYLIDLDDEEKKTFWKTVAYAGTMISCLIRTHLKMSRYKIKVNHEFVNVNTVTERPVGDNLDSQ